MLLWGLFTVGYILGVMFTLFVLGKRETNSKMSVEDIDISSSDSIYKSLTKVNYKS